MSVFDYRSGNIQGILIDILGMNLGSSTEIEFFHDLTINTFLTTLIAKILEFQCFAHAHH